MRGLKQNQLLTETLRGTCSTGGALVISTNPLKGGGVLALDFVAVRTPTVNAVVTIELVKGPVVMGVRTFKLTVADYWYTTRGNVRVPSDFSVRLTFSDAGTSKLCEASVYGYVEYPE